MSKLVKIISGEDVESDEEVGGKIESDKAKVITLGEAEESDEEDFGTISLDSADSLTKLSPELLFIPQRPPRLDPSLLKKQRERNKSLRSNITDKFLTPVIHQSSRKFEKLSQNLSNSQMQMQEALFQCRNTTRNLLKLQKELEYFLEEDYLKELKILPSDEVGSFQQQYPSSTSTHL